MNSVNKVNASSILFNSNVISFIFFSNIKDKFDEKSKIKL